MAARPLIRELIVPIGWPEVRIRVLGDEIAVQAFGRPPKPGQFFHAVADARHFTALRGFSGVTNAPL